MRGKLRYAVGCRQQIRITPADAGKTCCRSAMYYVKQDHPRGCGENAITFNRDGIGIGSPPRMRGKLHCIMFTAMLLRITPADAGKTSVQLKSGGGI